MKRLVFILILVLKFNVLAANPYVYYEKTDERLLTKNLVYSEYKQVTSEGLRDFYVLRVPLNDPNIKVKSTASLKEYGLKENVKMLLEENKALAGVNADFFGMKGSYSMPFGTVIRDGNLISTNPRINQNKNEYSSFVIDNNNNPFMTYIKTKVTFLNDGKKNLDIVSVNKVIDMLEPLCINKNAMSDTKSLDKRFPNLVKLVITNNTISYISKKGESVDIPDDGYIIVMSGLTADYNIAKFSVGQAAELKVESSIDLSHIDTMIGGVGRLLTNGKITHDDGCVIKGRQPRTAIGITQDKSTLIMVVLDGRTHSIGAEHDEIAQLMLRLGAYDAMHMDGGGSSTMVAPNAKTDALEVVNTLSDGVQRKVANAIGIYKPDAQNDMHSLKIDTNDKTAFKGLPFRVSVFGLDEYLNKIDIEPEVTFSSDDADGRWENNLFYPSRTGKIKLTAAYENFTAQTEINCVNIVSIKPSKNTITGSATLDVNGIGADGSSAHLTGVKFDVIPNELGHVEENTFVPDKSGAGYIKCSVGDVAAYIDVILSNKTQSLGVIENKPTINFVGYPDNNCGTVEYSNDKDDESIKLSCEFKTIGETVSSACVEFADGYNVGNPVNLTFKVFGDKSNAWLRARLFDANGNELTLDVAKQIDWEGWKDITVEIPEAAYPLSLKRLYIVSEQATSHTVYFGKISGLYKTDVKKISHPEDTKFKDVLQNDFANTKDDIICTGKMMVDEKKKPANYSAVINKLNTAGVCLNVGESNVPLSVKTIKQNDYSVSKYKNTEIVSMTAAKGGLLNSNPKQWQSFEKDIAKSDSKNIIIMLDKSPQNFKSNKEFELFHSALNKLYQQQKNILVISCCNKNSVSVKDGVRYINLAALDNNFHPLRINVNTNLIYKFD